MHFCHQYHISRLGLGWGKTMPQDRELSKGLFFRKVVLSLILSV